MMMMYFEEAQVNDFVYGGAGLRNIRVKDDGCNHMKLKDDDCESTKTLPKYQVVNTAMSHDIDAKPAALQLMDFHKIQLFTLYHHKNNHWLQQQYQGEIKEVLKSMLCFEDLFLRYVLGACLPTRELKLEDIQCVSSMKQIISRIRNHQDNFIRGEAYINALIILSRLITTTKMELTRDNLKLYVLTSLLLGMKWLSDYSIVSTKNFAELTDFPLQLLLQAEVELLNLLNFSVYISKEQYLTAMYLISSSAIVDSSHPTIVATILNFNMNDISQSPFATSGSLKQMMKFTKEMATGKRTPFSLSDITSIQL